MVKAARSFRPLLAGRFTPDAKVAISVLSGHPSDGIIASRLAIRVHQMVFRQPATFWHAKVRRRQEVGCSMPGQELTELQLCEACCARGLAHPEHMCEDVGVQAGPKLRKDLRVHLDSQLDAEPPRQRRRPGRIRKLARSFIFNTQ
jgi:hypothetical protein